MYAALTENGEMIYASQAASRPKERCKCPDCFDEVILKKSSQGKWFFAHKSACGKQVDNAKRPGEGELHRKAKRLVVEALKESYAGVEEEYYLPEIERTADIYVSGTKPTVIEIQVSPIDIYSLHVRTANYQGLGLRVIWLMTRSSKINFNSAWYTRMLQYSESFGLHRQFINVEAERLEIECFLPAIYEEENLTYSEIHRPIASIMERKPVQGDQFLLVKHQPTLSELDGPKVRESIRRTGSNYEALSQLYASGFKLVDLPEACLTSRERSLLLGQPMWHVYAWLCQQLKEEGGIWNYQRFTYAFETYIHKSPHNLEVLPFVKNTITKKLCCEYLFESLKRKKVLQNRSTEDASDAWVYVPDER